MLGSIEKGKIILNKYYSTYPQPETLKSFGNSFLLEYKSTNPFTNSKKSIKRIYNHKNTNSDSLLQTSEQQSLRYLQKPSRIEVEGTWESWLVDEKLHEGLIQDPLFGYAIKNKDQNKWVYVAKTKPEKTKSYFNGGSGNIQYVTDYGQGHPNKTHNAIFVRDQSLQKTYKVPNCQNLIVAAPIFLNDSGSQIMFQGYDRQQFGLSYIHNFNRKISLYIGTLQKDQYSVQKFNTEQQTNLFPSLSICGNYVAYFSGTGKTNCFYMNLVILKRNREEWIPHYQLQDFFIGSYMKCKIYFYELDGKPYFLVQTNTKGSNVIYSFDVEQMQLFNLTDAQPEDNYNIVSFNPKNNLLVLNYSNQNMSTFAFTYLPQPITIIPSESVNNFVSEYYQSPIPHFVQRKGNTQEKQPLIVMIHGGPHGSADSTINAFKYLFLEAGYTILIPNFSGSTGFGKEFLENALGRLGDVEGEQIIQCVQKLISQGRVDPKRVYSYGVCYGGFLSGILASKFHQYFTGSVMLNPIVSLPFMLNSSDIADWVMVQGLNKNKNTVELLTQQQNTHIYKLSPIANLPKIPICVFVGGKDIRVPPHATKQYVALTKKSGIQAQIYLYPQSDHKLSDSIQTFVDVLLKTFKFVEEHQQK